MRPPLPTWWKTGEFKNLQEAYRKVFAPAVGSSALVFLSAVRWHTLAGAGTEGAVGSCWVEAAAEDFELSRRNFCHHRLVFVPYVEAQRRAVYQSHPLSVAITKKGCRF